MKLKLKLDSGSINTRVRDDLKGLDLFLTAKGAGLNNTALRYEPCFS